MTQRLEFCGLASGACRKGVESTDSTGSEIPDVVEAMDLGMPAGLAGVRGTPLGLDATRADSSGDGLPDGEQVEVEWAIVEWEGGWQVEARVVGAVAHPALNDTSGDGVSDYDSVRGWSVDVVKKIGEKQPYRYDSGRQLQADEERATVRFYANAFQRDSSGNGIDDYVEKTVLKTDPRQAQTYGITADRETLLRSVYEEWASRSDGNTIAGSAVAMNLVESVDVSEHGEGIIAPAGDMMALKDVELTDASDAFGFVVRDESVGGVERFLYEMPDGEYGTDVWLSNEELLDSHPGLDPWAADTDSDGLTDGQEVYGVLWFESDLTGVNFDM